MSRLGKLGSMQALARHIGNLEGTNNGTLIARHLERIRRGLFAEFGNMNIPGIPGRGVNGSSGGGMSEQEQLMVKSVCSERVYHRPSIIELRREFIDASCNGKLPS